MTAADKIRVRISLQIRELGLDCASLSRQIGRNPSYIQQYLKYGTPKKLGEDDRHRLAEVLHIPEFYLRPALSDLSSGSFISQSNSYVHRIPNLNGVEKEISLDAQFIPAHSGAKLYAMSVCDQAMMPTLACGDTIIIDSTPAIKVHDGIYAVRVDSRIYLKRITVHPLTLRLKISMDNNAFATWDDCESADIDFVGRAIFCAKRIE
jgi:SOS-response transcriptional repressor LexA